MRRLNYELKQLGQRNRDGSYVTQANRAHMLSLIATQLYALGYTQLHATELKGRHANALVRRWSAEGLAPGTVKNRLSALRWWAEKIGRPWVLERTNTVYGVPARRTVAAASKARVLEADKLAAIRDPYVRLSLELQRAFGLRREEALKIRPQQADQGDWLVLQGSWTKGGRERAVPIRTAAQREVLDLIGQGLTNRQIGEQMFRRDLLFRLNEIDFTYQLLVRHGNVQYVPQSLCVSLPHCEGLPFLSYRLRAFRPLRSRVASPLPSPMSS